MGLKMPRLRRRRSLNPVTSQRRWDELPGSVRFETAWARRRHIRIEPMGDEVHFVAPRSRRWPGQPGLEAAVPQVVTRGALPDTVTCGGGYIEVLAFLENGIVVNEVRTHGDHVIAVPALGRRPDPGY